MSRVPSFEQLRAYYSSAAWGHWAVDPPARTMRGGETGGAAGCDNGFCCTCLDQNLDAWQCYDYYGGSYYVLEGPSGAYEVCASSEANAVTACENSASADSVSYTNVAAQQAPCYGNSASCSGWSPSTHISLNQGTYEIDQSFVDDLISDPSPLSSCDTARFTLSSSGSNYEVSGISSGDLLDELGFQNGDVVLTVNRGDIDGWDDVAHTFSAILNGTTYFDVVVSRSGTNVLLSFRIVP